MGDKLAGVHPKLKQAVGQIQTAMSALGFSMIVTDGVRTVDEQRALYAKGRSANSPGPIVTNADGITKKSKHQLHADGTGHAVDMVFLDHAGRPSWDTHQPWVLYGAMGKALGLTWGGEWSSPVDRPHLELPNTPS